MLQKEISKFINKRGHIPGFTGYEVIVNEGLSCCDGRTDFKGVTRCDMKGAGCRTQEG